MTVRYVKCLGADALTEHDLYRVTVIPANSLIGALLSRWPDAVWGLFDATGPLCYPAQGEPAVIDSTQGKAGTFDVRLRWTAAAGKSVQALAQSVTDAYPTTTVAQVERLTPSPVTIPERPVTQTATGQKAADEAQKDSALTALKSIGQGLLIAVVALAVIYGLSKVPSLK